MQVKFLPVDVFTQFKRDNNQTIKEQYLKMNSQFVKTEQELKVCKNQIQQCQQQIQQCQQQIQSLQTNVQKQFQDLQTLLQNYTTQNINTPQKNQEYKLFETSFPSLPTSSKEFQKRLDIQKGNLNIPDNCQVIYQPKGQNLQFSQQDENFVYEYSYFVGDNQQTQDQQQQVQDQQRQIQMVDICDNCIIFKTTNPVVLYIKSIDMRTLEVEVKPHLVIFYDEQLEVLPDHYLGKTWLKYNNCDIHEILMLDDVKRKQVLEISVSRFDKKEIQELKEIFPNLKIISSGFIAHYIE